MKIDVFLCLWSWRFRKLKPGPDVAVFRLALIVGLTAAMSLSAQVWRAGPLRTFIFRPMVAGDAFILVFLVVASMSAFVTNTRLAEKAIDLALMGWLYNKLGKILPVCSSL